VRENIEMWWQDTNYNRMTAAKSHGDELRAEAATNHAAPVDEIPGEVRIAVSGRAFQIGSLVIVLGRRLCEEDNRRAQGMRA
jgi:hypothetical protein